jgi:DNA processing protein
MNEKLKSDLGLIFLTYFTKYDIKLIWKIVATFQDCTIDEFLSAIKNHELRYEIKDNPDIKNVYLETQLCVDKLNYYRVKTESFFSKNYPAKLKNIADPPPVLYCKGSPLRKKKLVAVVGTRDASKVAEKVISLLVELFNRHDYGIVSGLALGIDSLAHKAAIEQKAYTVAVMAGALNDIYPKENFALANEIIDSGGTLISELPFGVSHGKRSFVMRNRIQAGISDYVLPVEMGIKSGTMTTVEFAYAQGKYIFLIPPIDSNKNLPQYEGINYFLQKSETEKYKRTFKITDLRDLESFLINQSFQRDLFNA